MSLRARQQRVLDGVERALRAGDPHLAGMFAIFARLNVGEPVGAEPRARRRRPRWPRLGPAFSAFVLVPVVFALIIAGALSGGATASSAKTCGVGPFGNQSACRADQPATTANQRTACVKNGARTEVPWPSSTWGMRQQNC
jgi:Protein of unknown function (DUF3040)